jgi:hypothetical protein
MITDYPAHFVGVPTNAAKVTEKINRLFPGIIPGELPGVTGTGRFYIPTPGNPLPTHPPFLVARFDQVINKSVQQRLLNAWDDLLHAGIRFPHADEHRSTTPALHLGIWETYRKHPIVTAATTHQSVEAIAAMDRFLYLIGHLVAPKLKNLLKTNYPNQYERQMR